MNADAAVGMQPGHMTYVTGADPDLEWGGWLTHTPMIYLLQCQRKV